MDADAEGEDLPAAVIVELAEPVRVAALEM